MDLHVFPRSGQDMDSAIDGKLRWERLEDYRKRRIEKFQDMVNDKLSLACFQGPEGGFAVKFHRALSNGL